MWIGGHWRKVCQTYGWGEENDQVVCRQLGFGPPLKRPKHLHLYAGTEMVRTHNVSYNCSGNEEMLTQCQPDMLNDEESCDRMEHVFVHCSGKQNMHGMNFGRALSASRN